jgi:hypothetical protein
VHPRISNGSLRPHLLIVTFPPSPTNGWNGWNFLKTCGFCRSFSCNLAVIFSRNLRETTTHPKHTMNPPHPQDTAIGLDRSGRKADLHLNDPRTGQHNFQTIDTAPEALYRPNN